MHQHLPDDILYLYLHGAWKYRHSGLTSNNLPNHFHVLMNPQPFDSVTVASLCIKYCIKIMFKRNVSSQEEHAEHSLKGMNSCENSNCGDVAKIKQAGSQK